MNDDRETLFLILCARIYPNSQDYQKITSLIGEGLDWKKLLDNARLEGILPLLYHNLKHFSDRIPSSVYKKLKEFYIRNTSRNIYFYFHIKPLLKAIDIARIKGAMIKGTRLAVEIYKDIGLRPFMDVDFIVYSQDRQKIGRILSELGFVQKLQKEILHNKKEEDELYWTYRPVYIKENLSVEIHYNFPGLHYNFSLEKDMWSKIEKRKYEGVSFQVLPLEYELCLLCLHAAQHSYSRLSWLTDIAEILTLEKIEWDRLFYICCQEKIHAPVYYTLKLVNFFWPESTPEFIIKKFPVKFYESWLLKLLWPKKYVLMRKKPLLFPMHTPTFFSLLGRRKFIYAMRTILSFYFPPRSWIVYYYDIPPHSVKIYLHYIWRLYRPILILSKRILRLN